MRMWRKKTNAASSGRGVARAALDDAPREELLQEALKTLVQQGRASRIGVWLEADEEAGARNENIAAFHGSVWDHGNRETPQEWAHLSVEPPLPHQMLLRGKTVEQDLSAAFQNSILGLLAGVHHALWVPIAKKERLQGVILVGSFGKEPAISREDVESVAAELALALGLEEEQRTARLRKADLGVVRYFMETQSSDISMETLILNLVESCTEAPAIGEGLGASFAAIGALRHDRKGTAKSFPIEFLWRSGDESWTRAIAREPLASIWRQALESRRVVGSESQTSGSEASVVRIVAFPLESEGQLVGTLIAGLPRSAVSLSTLGRLELRAALTAAALQQRKRKEQETQLADWPNNLLKCVSEPLLLLDDAGKITAASRGARELIRPALKTEPAHPEGIPANTYLPELFCAQDQPHLETWLRARLDREADRHGAKLQPFRAELLTGVKVRLSLAVPVQGQAIVVSLEPLAAHESTGQAGNAEIELQSVIEWLEEGVVLFDAQNNIRAMNARFEQITGLAPQESGKIKTLEELIGRLKNQAAEPERFAEQWRELARRIESGVGEELQMAHPAPRILERAARPVLDPVGRLLGRVEVYRDLTAQRAFHSKLLQTEKLAALGQLVSGIAHELSNPLTSILGYAQRILARQDLPGRTEEVRQISEEAERASSILRQLLLNARETLPDRRLVSLNQIVQRAMDLQRFSLAAEKIRVQVDLDPALPLVQGDPGNLQQVLMNLVGNARQAIEQNGKAGVIQLRTKKIGERRVLLEVADNGPGVPQAILARIFDPFFTTKPAGVGTGLGLAIVLSVVREHGGKVNVLSPPRGGAIFQIELPAATETAQDSTLASPFPGWKKLLPKAEEIVARGKNSAPESELGNGGRVLVVEDEPTVARLIADVLEDEGMRVEILMDGREALERASQQTFDLVICDMKMPGLDGQHFYKSLERSGNPLRKRFLFVTGDVIAAHTREFLDRHHLPHVAKPFRVEELTEKVHGVLATTAHRQGLPAEAARKTLARNG
jgi:signal transduction histidine kinase/AmiR/NasT family two-component response regulator